MMYNYLLDTFVKVVECGSFSRAAEILFLSRVSVMKQVNSLEERIGVKLLNRTNTGIKTTLAGEAVYQDAKKMIEESDRAIERARKIASGNREEIRIGSSFLNPGQPLVELWEQIREEYPQYKIRMVAYSDDHETMKEMKSIIGERFDLMIGVADSRQWDKSLCFYQLGSYRINCAVPKNHRLAKRKCLTPDDLKDETVMMVEEGDSAANDRVREYLRENYPDIRIRDAFHYYDLETFDECLQQGCVLLTFSLWSKIHPSLVTIPMDWEFAVPYGIVYSRRPTPGAAGFLEAIRSGIDTGRITFTDTFSELLV